MKLHPLAFLLITLLTVPLSAHASAVDEHTVFLGEARGIVCLEPRRTAINAGLKSRWDARAKRFDMRIVRVAADNAISYEVYQEPETLLGVCSGGFTIRFD